MESGEELVEEAIVTIGENSTTTDSDGYYVFEKWEGNENYEVDVEVSGYESFSENLSLES